MKAKFVLLIGLIFSLTAFAQNTEVPKKVKDAFAKLHPKAADVKWDKEGKEEFEASFKEGSVKISVVLNDDGKLMETETVMDIKALPTNVKKYVSENYKGFSLTEAAKIVDNKGITTFEAEITKGKEKKDLIFDKAGKPLTKHVKKSEKEEDEKDEED
ncbi:MAG: PepSY-like domain-containing protein [Ignavibacteriaceae bacterium]|nr:PepSY-like domain-containing protein [Ignavibacteriaceae bacterium]